MRKEIEKETEEKEKTKMKNDDLAVNTVASKCNNYINPDQVPGIVSYQNAKLKVVLVFLITCITTLLFVCAGCIWLWQQQQEAAATELQKISEQLQQKTGELAVMGRKINEMEQVNNKTAIQENNALLLRLNANEQKYRDLQRKLEELERAHQQVLQKAQTKPAAPPQIK